MQEIILEDKTFRSILQRLWQLAIRFYIITAFLLAIMCHLLYCVRMDTLAAFTFIPGWIWLLAGTTTAIPIAFYKRSVASLIFLIWLLFAFLNVEEAASLTRAIFYRDLQTNSTDSQHRLTVVSLNCVGGQIAAARETNQHNPDFVLLQETPPIISDLQSLADQMFNNNGHVLLGADTTILCRFPIEEIPTDRSSGFVEARLQLPSGRFAHVISLRLNPPVINTNLLSSQCWQDHYQDRLNRRQKIQRLRDRIETIPKEEAVIFGGDFNVPANDGCLRALKDRLTDAFSLGGIGWGHTALNDVPLFRIDQIWVSRNLSVDSVRAHRSNNSDHRMVICRLLDK